MTEIKLGSLFDGIGVFPLAASRNGITPVWASEIEKAPISITKKQFPNMEHLGDITRVNGGDIPPVHVLTFGSPCQNLSQIGNRSGLAGVKSSLFFQAIRIIKEMRDATDDLFPVIAVWENVMGAFSCAASPPLARLTPEQWQLMEQMAHRSKLFRLCVILHQYSNQHLLHQCNTHHILQDRILLKFPLVKMNVQKRMDWYGA